MENRWKGEWSEDETAETGGCSAASQSLRLKTRPDTAFKPTSREPFGGPTQTSIGRGYTTNDSAGLTTP